MTEYDPFDVDTEPIPDATAPVPRGPYAKPRRCVVHLNPKLSSLLRNYAKKTKTTVPHIISVAVYKYLREEHD